MKYDLELIEPNRKIVMDAVKKTLDSPDFKIHNDELNRLFEDHNKNDDYDKVYLKVLALNTYYSAGVKSIHIMNMVKHILFVYNQKKYKDNACLINNPSEPNDHCIKLVTELSNLEVGVEKDGKVINKVWHYDSFASKFCFFQNNKFFFIFDSYVSELLFEFKNKFKDKYEEKFGKDFKDFTKEGLRNYDTFYIAINQFITFFGLQSQGEFHY